MCNHRTIMLFAGFCLLIAISPRVLADDPSTVSGPYFFFSTDATVTNSRIPVVTTGDPPPNGIVGYSNFTSSDGSDSGPFTGPVTVNLTFSDNATWQYNMYVFNASTINLNGGDNSLIAGGTIQGDLTLNDTSKAILGGQGSAMTVDAYDQSSVTLQGGAIGTAANGQTKSTGGLFLNDNSTANVSGGYVSSLVMQGGATTITGGQVDEIQAFNSGSTVTVTNGSNGGILVEQGASVTISGGVTGGVSANDNGGATIQGGVVTGAANADYGTVIIEGGTVGGLAAFGNTGSAVMDGGVMTDSISAFSSSSISVTGGTINGNVSVGTLSTINLSSVPISGSASEIGATLNINSGTAISGNVTAQDGQLTMSGGSVTGNLTASGAAIVTLSGSIGGNLQASNGSTIYINGGSVGGSSTISDSAQLYMSGGTVAGVSAHSSSAVYISGGSDSANLDSYNSSTVYVQGSIIQGSVNSHDASQISISGGGIYGGVNAYDNSTINWSGGFLLGGTAAVNVYGSAKFIWSGGTITSNAIVSPLSTGPVNSNARPLAQPAGGPVPIYINDSGTLEVDGINISASFTNSTNSTYLEFAISGYFADGTVIPSGVQFFVQDPTGTINASSLSFVSTTQKWSASAGGSWADAANWSPAIIADNYGAVANFSNAKAPATVSLDGDRVVGELTLAGDNAYSIVPGSGGTLTLGNNVGDASITVVSGNHEILAPVTTDQNTILNIENGVTNGQFYTASLALTGGITVGPDLGNTLELEGDGILSTAFVRGGTLLVLQGDMSIIPNGTAAGASSVEGLQVTHGKLDLTNNSLIINNSVLSDIVSLVVQGQGSGPWNGRYGITSSSAAANPLTSLGVITGAQFLGSHPDGELDGNPVADTDVVIKYAYFGDANLDGKVDASDYSLIDSGYLTHATGWFNGDFNYDGVVNGSDYTLIDNAFNTQGAVLDASIGNPYARVTSEFTSNASVPEPSAGFVLGAAAIGLLSRRYRPLTPRP